MDAEIIFDPYAALETERRLHLKLLKDFERVIKRSETRSAVGNIARQFCSLCESPNCGTRERDYRGTCPAHHNRAHVREQIERLEAGWVKSEDVPPPPVVPPRQPRNEFISHRATGASGTPEDA